MNPDLGSRSGDRTKLLENAGTMVLSLLDSKIWRTFERSLCQILSEKSLQEWDSPIGFRVYKDETHPLGLESTRMRLTHWVLGVYKNEYSPLGLESAMRFTHLGLESARTHPLGLESYKDETHPLGLESTDGAPTGLVSPQDETHPLGLESQG
ncbi:hypothetical protein AVEN_116733-1 [Araneus ventricosus]|uniref:Uncharacterized protein n=1 Tax=Araneus ventricosus TaxID=182803 RepID=A0A4Y2MYI2_ARAVE|nr:hypothetical protein AVEN_116733-1 [Araneus ventricosus]